MGGKYDIFISHPQQGVSPEWPRRLARALQERGLTVWLDEDQIKPGEDWGHEILEGLERSSNVVFVVGAGANESNAVGLELGMVLAAGKRIIPVVDADLPQEEIPGPLKFRQPFKKDDPRIVAEEIAEALAVPQSH